MNHYLTPTEYIKVMRNLAILAEAHESEHLNLLMIELGRVPVDDCIYEISDILMARLAIINLCDMALIQYRDSNGEIDYASLDRHSLDVVENIIRNIYYYIT